MKKLFGSVLIIFCLLTHCLCFAYSSEDIYRCFKESYRYEKMGAYNDAIKALLPVYKTNPRFYLVNLRLGWLYYLSGKYRNSIKYYKKAIEINSYSFEAKLGLSLPLLAQKDWIAVERLMRQILTKDPYNYYANLRLAISLRFQNKANQAEKVARQMLRRYPTSVDFLVELGRDLLWQGKKDQAKKIFQKVLLLDPENVIARQVLKK